MKKRFSLVFVIGLLFALTFLNASLYGEDLTTLPRVGELNASNSQPAEPLGPPAPLTDVIELSSDQCKQERCVGTLPAIPKALHTQGEKKHTKGSNSQLVIPQNLLLADVNADSKSDFIQYADNKIFVAKTDFEKTGLLHFYLRQPVKRILTGDFHGQSYDQVCANTIDGALICFGISTDQKELWWWFTQGAFFNDSEDTIVADFDGDGRDDVLVYPRSGGEFRMYSVKTDAFFEPMPQFAQGNLAGINSTGMQIRAGDFNADGRDDILAVNTFGQILRYDSVHDGENQTFWWAFTTVANFVGANKQITVARIDDNKTDDVILRDQATGDTQFYHLEWNDGSLPPITNVNLGQLSTIENSLVFWGNMHGNLDEPGARNRDDAMVYDLVYNMFRRSDARWSGSNLTYWWAYTQHAPNNHTGWASLQDKPWLILKCKVTDINTEPHNVQFYRDLNSTHIQYWHDQSYGSWDLSGSDLIDEWLQMPLSNGEWKKLNRYDKAGACIDTYQGSKAGYVNIISMVNGHGDSGNDSGRVLADSPPNNPEVVFNLLFISHETGHTFGWDHSFDDTDRKNTDWSQPGEYFDHWDIMSARNVYGFKMEQGFVAGPNLNAPYRTKQSFIPDHRIEKLSQNDVNQGVTLNIAALARPEANGPLMVRIGNNNNNYFTFEYRIKESWDQGIPTSTILVHQVKDGISYLKTTDETERLTGSASTFVLDGWRFNVRVNEFADEGYTANVTIDTNCNPSVNQVSLYTDKDYAGTCVVKNADEYTSSTQLGLPSNSISSIKVGEGTSILLCGGDEYLGTCETLTQSDPDLSDNDIGDNQVSSFKATCQPSQDEVALYLHSNFGGRCVIKSLGEYKDTANTGLPYQSISSIRVGANVSLKVCSQANFGGTCETLFANDSNLTNNAVGNDQIISVSVEKRNKIFLPINFNRFAPDLVVTEVRMAEGNVVVVITNQGSRSITSPFWVDLYVDPNPIPLGVNDVWEDGRSQYGLVWGVETALKAGESLELTKDDIYYWAGYSNFPEFSLPDGTQIFVQVDSANMLSAYGNVIELDEVYNDIVYNNIISVTVSKILPTSMAYTLQLQTIELQEPLPRRK